MDIITQTDLLAELERRLEVEAAYEGGAQGTFYDGLRQGYKDSARMLRELRREAAARP